MGNTIVAAYIEPSKEAPCFEEDAEQTGRNITSNGQNDIIPEDSLNGTIKARALSVGIEAVTSTGIEREARG